MIYTKDNVEGLTFKPYKGDNTLYLIGKAIDSEKFTLKYMNVGETDFLHDMDYYYDSVLLSLNKGSYIIQEPINAYEIY